MFHCLFRTRAFLIFGLVVSLLHTHLWAYQPKDAKVQAILNKAIAYLEAQPTDPKTERIAGSAAVTPQQWNTMMGYKMLIAYAIYKHRKNKNHPKVKAAIASAVEAMNADPVKMGRKAVYELGVAISFLTEFDDPQIDQLVVKMYNHLLTHQKSNGSFAYGGDGDTSLTQYAILAMWSVKEANLIPNFDNGPVERACNWLMRTQGVSGNWAYHGKDPGTFKRVPQTFEATLSTFVAGAGSLYITADILGFHKQTTSSDTPFTSVNSARTRGNRPTTTAVSEQYLWESLSLADRFWSTNGRLQTAWQYYYMYGQERFLSFRNEVLGMKEPKEGPPWYNEGVNFLEKAQANNGSFKSKENPAPAAVDTALAALFLLRSTKEKIHPPTSGTLLGGQGIPDNFKDAVQTDTGEVVSPTKSNKVEDLNTLIRAMQNKDFDADGVEVGDLIIRKEVEKSQLDLLREQVKHPSYQVRLSTVRVLSKGGLDNAPVLIYALSDPDNRIMQVARDALRLTSRKLQGFGLPDTADEEQKKVAQRQWSEWLRAIRPDLEF